MPDFAKLFKFTKYILFLGCFIPVKLLAAPPIEALQNSIQQRWQLAFTDGTNGAYNDPPEFAYTTFLAVDSQHPADLYPTAGYYNEALNIKTYLRQLVDELVNKTQTLANSYHLDVDLEGSTKGFSSFGYGNVNFDPNLLTKVASVIGSPPANDDIPGRIAWIENALSQMKTIAFQSSRKYVYWRTGEGTSQTLACDGAYPLSLSDWGNQSWGQAIAGYGGQLMLSHNSNSIQGLPPSQSSHSNITNKKGNAYVVANDGLSDASVQINFFAEVQKFGNYPQSNAPFPLDAKWHSYDTKNESGKVFSKDLCDEPGADSGCGEYGMSVDRLAVVVTATFHDDWKATDDCGCKTTCSKTSIGSIEHVIQAGKSNFGRDANSISFISKNLTESVCTPDILSFSLNGGGTLLRNPTTKQPWQYKTAQSLFVINVVHSKKFQISEYSSSLLGSPNTDGSYTPPSSAEKTFTFEIPNTTSPGAPLEFVITEENGTLIAENRFTHDSASDTWTLHRVSEDAIETLASIWNIDHNERTEVREITNASDVILSRKSTVTKVFPWGEAEIQNTTYPSAGSRSTYSTYYTNSTQTGKYSHLKTKITDGANWESYDYDTSGRIIKKVIGLKASTPFSSDAQNIVTTWQYGSNPFEAEIETTAGAETARHYRTIDYTTDTIREITCTKPGAAWNDSSNLITATSRVTGGVFSGQLQKILRPDGAISLTTYSRASDESSETAIVAVGQPNSTATAVVDGTSTASTVDQAGNLLSEVVTDISSDLVISSKTRTSADAFGRATGWLFEDGTTESMTYGCCGVETRTDRLGITTSYGYDAAGRVTSETRNGLTTITGYDVAGNILSTNRQGTDATSVALSSNTYDLAGHRTQSITALSRTTTFTETLDNDGLTVATTTRPDANTEIQTSYPDGRLKSISGTGVHPLAYEYGVESITVGGNTFNASFTKEIRIGENGAETEWSKTYLDMASRTCRILTAAGATTDSIYNAKGQLIRQIDPDGVSLLTGYNLKGEPEITCLDLNRDGVIDYAGSDRITRAQRTVAEHDGHTVLRSTTSQWQTDGSDTPTVLSVTETAAGGLLSWQTNYGLTTATSTSISSGNRTITTVYPDASRSVQTYTGDYLTSESRQDSSNNQLWGRTLSYDPHGRLQSDTDARNGATTYTWFDDDQINTVTTPAPGDGSAAQTTTSVYFSDGRKQKDTLPDSGEVNYTYWPTGEIHTQNGTRTYPQETSYDTQGRLTTLSTWQDFSATSGAATTTWNYDPVSGFLSGKTYQDSSGPTYTYSAAGRLLTRTNARSILTTYGQNNAGENTAISYSDSTPAVALLYDRAGRVKTVTDAAGRRTLGYTSAGQLDQENFTTGLLRTAVIDPGYDSLLRRDNLQVRLASTVLLDQGYTYGAASRLATTSSGDEEITYAYLSDSPLVGSVTTKHLGDVALTRTSSYDALNRLSDITHSAATATAVTASYAYNTANQRTKLTREDATTVDFGYDSLGQVTSGVKKLGNGDPVLGAQFAYSFDTIGNRITATVNGRTSTLTPNLVNQITSQTIPGAFDLRGEADSGTTVTVNTEATSRQGNYFYHELSADNSTAPVWQSISILGEVTPDSITRQGHLYLPKTPLVPTYDADGNRTGDGQWDYTWDGENRLVAAETNAAALAAGVPRSRITYTYDYASRRVQKQDWTWDATTSGYVLERQTKFLYDGWNLLTEITTNRNNQLLNQKIYTWGQDISGTQQGAGGVGGLLTEAISFGSKTITLLPTYDGNGNILTMLDTATGALAAEYEYGPFGEPLKTVGTYAEINPFRFSTKYTDNETGLIYYGYRYYDTNAGSWLSRDPIEEEGGLNLYGYVLNNPLVFVDPLGLGTWDFSITLGVFGNQNPVVDAWYTMDQTEAKCCEEVIVRRYAKKFGFWGADGDGDPAPVITSKKGVVAINPAHAEPDQPGPMFPSLGHRSGLTYKFEFRWEAICTKGKSKGKTLSTTKKNYSTKGITGKFY